MWKGILTMIFCFRDMMRNKQIDNTTINLHEQFQFLQSDLFRVRQRKRK